MTKQEATAGRRGRDEGSIRWKPDRENPTSVQAAFSLVGPKGRHRVTKTFPIATDVRVDRARRAAEREAEAWLAEQLRLKRTGMAIDPRSRTVADVLDEWMAAKTADGEWGPTTRVRTRQFVEQRLKPELGYLRLDRLTANHIRRMLEKLRQPGTWKQPVDRRTHSHAKALSPTTVRHIYGALKACLNWCVQQDYLDPVANPIRKVAAPRQDRRVIQDHMWSGEELGRFLDGERDSRDYPIWQLLACTGMRRGEALGLQWGDVDLDAASLRIRRRRLRVGSKMVEEEGTKTTKEGRTIDLDPETVAVLRRFKQRQREERLACGAAYAGPGPVDEQWIFVRQDGQPVTAQAVDSRWRSAVKRSGLPVIRLHDLRHVHAAVLINAGIPIPAVSARLGHASTQMTLDVYSFAVKGSGSVAAATFAAALAREEPVR